MLACVRRELWLVSESEPGQRDYLTKRAVDTANELVALDETGQSHVLLALVLIDKGELAAARAALLEAEKRGFQSPDASKLLAAMNAKTRLIDKGPVPVERQFGTLPLIHATLETPLGLSALKGLKVTLNGKQVPATIYGSQILYVPQGPELAGGAHVVNISAGEASGAPIQFPEFTYLVDKEPPVVSLTPPPGNIKTDTIFSVDIKDASGVDWSTLSMGLRSQKVASAVPFDVVFIRDGHFSHPLPALKIRSGESVVQSPFKITAPNGIPPGDYKMWIEVRDVMAIK